LTNSLNHKIEPNIINKQSDNQTINTPVKQIDPNTISLTGNKFQTLQDRLGSNLMKNIQKVENIDNSYKAFTNLQKSGQNTNFHHPQ
jgi:hypothetical protein